MDIVSIGLILAFCLAGALVAFVADNLGRHLGKRRLSIFGLRPRHTGSLITTLAGFVIPLLTTLLLAAASSDLRTILREGASLIVQRDRTKVDLQKSQQELAGTQQELNKTSQQVETATKNFQDASVKLKNAVTLREKSEAMVLSLGRQANDLRKQLEPLRIRIEAASRKLAESQRKNAVLDKKNQELAYRNFETSRSFLQQKKLLDEAYSEYNRMDREIQALQQETKRLAQEKTEALANSQQLQLELEKRLAEVDRVNAEIRRKQSELDELERKTVELYRSFTENSATARTRGLVYGINDEVSRATGPAGMSYPEADRLVDAAIRDAVKAAASRGAARVGPYDYADFRERQVTNEDGTIVRTISVAAQRNALREDLVNQSEPQLLILQSIWNTFAGESVPLRYVVLRNPIVYPAGTVISEARIRADRDKKSILDQVESWLTVAVPAKLRVDGMIPVVGQENSLATVTRTDVLNVVDSLKAENRQIRIQMLATAEIRASGPLKFEFRLR